VMRVLEVGILLSWSLREGMEVGKGVDRPFEVGGRCLLPLVGMLWVSLSLAVWEGGSRRENGDEGLGGYGGSR
jgi:hypothetical protein